MNNRKLIIGIVVMVIIALAFGLWMFIFQNYDAQPDAIVPFRVAVDVPPVQEAGNETIQSSEGAKDVMKGSLIVTVKDSLTDEQARSLLGRFNNADVYKIAPHVWELRFDPTVDLVALNEQLSSITEVLTVDYNDVLTPQYLPNDYSLQTSPNSPWWLDEIEAQSAWDVTKGDAAVIVAVIDDSPDFTVADLSGKGSLVSSASIQLTGGDHGTHVAGIIGAHTDNALGVASIGFNTALLGYNVCEPLDCYVGPVITALSDIHDRIVNGNENIKVINMSLGGNAFNSAFESAINQVYADDVVVVAAAGNDFVEHPYRKVYPAAFDNVISVAALSPNGGISSFSQRNGTDANGTPQNWVDVIAPGEEIVSTVPNGTYASYSGTSMAAPILSGAVALARAANPALTADEIRNIVINTSLETPVVGVQYGKVNADKIVRAAKSPLNYDPVIGDVCDAWSQTALIPNATQTHQSGSIGVNGVYYVTTMIPKDTVYYASQYTDGSLGLWQSAAYDDWRLKGDDWVSYNGGIIKTPYGHVLTHAINPDNSIGPKVQLDANSDAFDIAQEWGSLVLAQFDTADFLYYFGTFDTSGAHNYNLQFWQKKLPVGPGNYKFTKAAPANPGFIHYKTAFVKGDGDKGFIYSTVMDGAGTSVVDGLKRIEVHADATTSGAFVDVSAPPGNGNLRGELFSYNGYLYAISGTKFSRAYIDPASGDLGYWEPLADVPAPLVSLTGWAGHPESAAYALMNGFVYVTGVDRVYFISLTGNCTTVPAPIANKPSGTQGSPVGSNISCVVPAWVIRGPDVVVPPITCGEVMIEVDNPDYSPPAAVGNSGNSLTTAANSSRCDECASAYVFPQPGFISENPTGQDVGQKDGTGQTGLNRNYSYYDYDQGALINIPPFGFGVGGPQPLADIGGDVDASSEAPCGWPSDRAYRKVGWGCATPAVTEPDQEICPKGMAAGSWCAENTYDSNGNVVNQGQHDDYKAVDIAGEFPVYATMDGTAFRCVDKAVQAEGTGSFGIYIVVVNGQGTYRTINAHQLPDPSIDYPLPSTLPNDTACAYGDGNQRETKRWSVKRGDLIGYVGMTGQTNIQHLHYEIRTGVTSATRVCPASFIDSTNVACKSTGALATTSIVSRVSQAVSSFFSSLNPFASNEKANDAIFESGPSYSKEQFE